MRGQNAGGQFILAGPWPAHHPHGQVWEENTVGECVPAAGSHRQHAVGQTDPNLEGVSAACGIVHSAGVSNAADQPVEAPRAVLMQRLAGAWRVDGSPTPTAGGQAERII